MSNFRISTHLVAFRGSMENSNPLQRTLDWQRTVQVADAENAVSTSGTLAPGETRTLFSGARTLLVDNTTEFSIELVPGETGVYRIRHTDGMAPGFRTTRTLSGIGSASVAVTVNADATVFFDVTSGTFAGALAGDILWLPGDSEGVSSPFELENQGFWQILKATSARITARRLQGLFNGVSQSAVSVDATTVRAFSSDGVQAGEKIALMDGFVSANLNTFPIGEVTDAYVDVIAGGGMVAETGVLPGTDGVAAYRASMRYVRVETDRECVVRVNGDSGNLQRLQPWEAGKDGAQAEYVRTGSCHRLDLVNSSSFPCAFTMSGVE